MLPTVHKTMLLLYQYVALAHGGRGNSSSIDRHGTYGGGGGGGRGAYGVSKRSDYRVLVTGFPSSASWQNLKGSHASSWRCLFFASFQGVRAWT
ncbi:hypothetical protein Hdeb2414_s0001g00016291 [Helianthus debilis subsp. tardiflorus]